MIQPEYKHVLFKDLLQYVRKTDYLGGYSVREQAYIRKNIGAASADEVAEIAGKAQEITYTKFRELLRNKELSPGALYIISDFQTMWEIDGKSYQSDILPLAVIALSKTELLPEAAIIGEDTMILYNPVRRILSDGTTTKGSIIYMKDKNNNQANYDFKRIKWKEGYTFQKDGKENSSNCYDNNLCFTRNVVIKQDIKGLYCRINDVVIDTELDLTDGYLKQIIKTDSQIYLNYLDLETLTNQFYELVAVTTCISTT